MRLARGIPIALFSLGVILVGIAVATGSARLYLLLVFPVVAGSSGWLLGGIASFFLGFLTLPLVWSEGDTAPPTQGPDPPRLPEGERPGGVVLLGPIPIFFGSWRRPSRRVYWLAVAVGAALFVGFLVALLLFAV